MMWDTQHTQTEAARLTTLLSEAERIANRIRLPRPPFMARTPYHPTQARPFTGHDREFWQFRLYQSGDNVRAIDWRKSAAQDDILIKEHQRHDHAHLSIWLDGRPSMRNTPNQRGHSKYNHGSLALLALLQLMTEHEIRAHPILTDPPTTTQTLTQTGQALLDSSSLPIDPDRLLHMDLPTGSLILISDFWEDPTPWHNRLSHLSTRFNSILMLQIASAEEWDIPFQTRTRLIDPTGLTSPLTFDSFDRLRPSYQERLKVHLNTLDTIARRHRAHLYKTRTDHDLVPILSYLLSGEEFTR